MILPTVQLAEPKRRPQLLDESAICKVLGQSPTGEQKNSGQTVWKLLRFAQSLLSSVTAQLLFTFINEQGAFKTNMGRQKFNFEGDEKQELKRYFLPLNFVIPLLCGHLKWLKHVHDPWMAIMGQHRQ